MVLRISNEGTTVVRFAGGSNRIGESKWPCPFLCVRRALGVAHCGTGFGLKCLLARLICAPVPRVRVEIPSLPSIYLTASCAGGGLTLGTILDVAIFQAAPCCSFSSAFAIFKI